MMPDRKTSALLVVDMQNDFCPGGTLGVTEGNLVLGPINKVMPLFDYIVLTQDWHPRNHVSFASSHPGKRPSQTVEVPGGTQLLWPDHCVEGSDGAAFHRDLDTDRASMILRKGMRLRSDSYSAFAENNTAMPTGLGGWLLSLGIRRLYVVGLATDYCVLYSSLDALSAGFEVLIIADATKGVDVPKGTLDAALLRLGQAGASYLLSSDLG
ncbi:MAG: bifunctional nicotinamidase/pyrazinamidase [Spirochaetota bacterium]